MTDPHRLTADRRSAFNLLRIAESEINYVWVHDGKVPAEWWDRLLDILAQYEAAVRRCKGGIDGS